LARIVAEPNLVALDGQPARFIAGGSFPFPVPQAGVNGANVITIQFRDFGAILQFVPHIIGDDAIRLDVEPSFSELNFGAGTSVDGTTVPGINQRSARTVVELREGQTLAIAGLLQNRTNASTARIPLLGDAPIIGPFFSKNHIETLETELVVLVTPVVVEGLEPNEVPQAPGDWYREPNDCEFYLLGRIEGRTGKPFRSTLQELDPFNMMRHHRSEQAWVVGPHGFAD
jgi:pilus assembly protein CpaC